VHDPSERARVDGRQQAVERRARPVGPAPIEVVNRCLPEVLAVQVDDVRGAGAATRRRERQRGGMQRIVDDEAGARGAPREIRDVATELPRRRDVRRQRPFRRPRQQAVTIIEQQREATR